jgi:uncharacterized repeat protein (TIGR02543 family)
MRQSIKSFNLNAVLIIAAFTLLITFAFTIQANAGDGIIGIRTGEQSYTTAYSLNYALENWERNGWLKEGDTLEIAAWGTFDEKVTINKRYNLTITQFPGKAPAVFNKRVEITGGGKMEISGLTFMDGYLQTGGELNISDCDFNQKFENDPKTGEPWYADFWGLKVQDCKVDFIRDLCFYNATAMELNNCRVSEIDGISNSAYGPQAEGNDIDAAADCIALNNTTVDVMKNCTLLYYLKTENPKWEMNPQNRAVVGLYNSSIDLMENCTLYSWFVGINMSPGAVIENMKDCNFYSEKYGIYFGSQTDSPAVIKNVTGKTVIRGRTASLFFSDPSGNSTISIEKDLNDKYGTVLIKKPMARTFGGRTCDDHVIVPNGYELTLEGPDSKGGSDTYYQLMKTCNVVRVEPNGGKYLYDSTWRTEPYEFDVKADTVIGDLYPSRSGYKFDGYYLDADFTVPWNINDKVDKDITIYFKWKNSDGSSYGVLPDDGGDIVIVKASDAEVIDKALALISTNTDLSGSVFRDIQLSSSKQTKDSIKLNWNKPSGAVTSVVYGSADGNSSYKKIGTVTGTSATVTKIGGSALNKGKYYKFIVVALDNNDKAVSISKVIHVATAGGKTGNYKKVTVKAKVGGKTKAVSKVTIKKGKTLKLKATATPSKKVKKYTGIRFESSNKKVATVTSKGKIKAKAKGSCVIYAYAQNGVKKEVKVTVK